MAATNAVMVLGYILHSKGPKHRQIAGDCLDEIIRKQFHFRFGKSDENHTMLLTMLVAKNMSSPAHEIQENIIKRIHEISKWYLVEVLSYGNQVGFESFDECSNTQENNEQEDNDEDKDEDENEKKQAKDADCEKHFIIDFKTTFYVIIVDNENTFDNIMEVLENSNSFNPRALYLVYVESDYRNCRKTARNILEKMWDKVLIRTAVLIPQSLQVLKLYKLNTLTKGPFVCGTNITLMEIDSCVKGRMENAQQNYYAVNSDRNHFNCSMHVISKPYEPFVINETAGFEIEVLQNIGTILNINFNISISRNMTDTWGTKEENGSWTGNLKFIYDDFYLGVGNVETGMGYDTDFVSSRQYHMEPLVYVVPIAQFVPKWRVLIAIFTLQMWGVCLGIIILFAVAFCLTSKFGEGVADFKKLGKCFSTSLQIIINHSVTTQPTSDLTRVFFLSLAIFSIIIASSYTSSLVYYLKNPIREHQPTTNLELLSDSGYLRYEVGGVSRYRELFNVSDQQAYQVFQAYQIANGSNDTVLYWIHRVAQDRDIWTISSKFFANYLLSGDSNVTSDENGRPRVFVFKQKLRSYSIGIIMRKGHPVQKQIDHVIKKLVWGGLVEQMRSKYRHAILKKQGLAELDDNYKPLTLNHLQGAFALLLLGYALGFLSVIVEAVTKKITERKKRKKVASKIC